MLLIFGAKWMHVPVSNSNVSIHSEILTLTSYIIIIGISTCNNLKKWFTAVISGNYGHHTIYTQALATVHVYALRKWLSNTFKGWNHINQQCTLYVSHISLPLDMYMDMYKDVMSTCKLQWKSGNTDSRYYQRECLTFSSTVQKQHVVYEKQKELNGYLVARTEYKTVTNISADETIPWTNNLQQQKQTEKYTYVHSTVHWQSVLQTVKVSLQLCNI